MPASRTLFAFVAAGAIAALGGSLAQAQEKTDGSDYHPLMMSSPVNAATQADAVAATHPDGNEPIGQSTSAPFLKSSLNDSDVYAGAVAAAHASGTEAIGQSTSLPFVQSVH